MNRVARERRFSAIKALGCIACRMRGGWLRMAEVHHLNLGGHAGQRRRGDEFTVGLCDWHHRGCALISLVINVHDAMGPSLAHEPRRFREVFGTDDELLAEQNRLIAEHERLRV